MGTPDRRVLFRRVHITSVNRCPHSTVIKTRRQQARLVSHKNRLVKQSNWNTQALGQVLSNFFADQKSRISSKKSFQNNMMNVLASEYLVSFNLKIAFWNCTIRIKTLKGIFPKI